MGEAHQLGELIIRLLQGGLGNLASYLAAHVLLCLVPAFFIAGAMTALVPKQAITRLLGRSTPRAISYPAAALAGSVLAVCSCTIVPIFAGIYRKGAGLGPAITFLFFAPAANILALIYTGGLIGADLAIARLILSLAFGIGIGMIMALIFRHEDAAHDRDTDALFAGASEGTRSPLYFLLGLVVVLLVGTLKLDFLSRAYAEITLSFAGGVGLQEALLRLIPFDATRGEEGVSVQGAILIAFLALIAVTAWRGLRNIDEGWNRWAKASLALMAVTLLIAAARIAPRPEGLSIGFTGRFVGMGLGMTGIALMARWRLGADETRAWLAESYRFIRQIFPLLIVGVFAVGIARQVIRPEWIKSLAGGNTLLGNAAGVLFGVFMYFPTLVEVPIAKMFLSLGMHRGPLLAYLMADPELSLQSILIISAIIGRTKTWTYVGLVAVFSALAGLIYGAWVDRKGIALLFVYLIVLLSVVALGLLLVKRRNRRRAAARLLASQVLSSPSDSPCGS
ncbi:MAG: permease [Candidatus Eisenbacteria bacterium]|nr:permease [Candidatus Eisenbacteria bacterium]